LVLENRHVIGGAAVTEELYPGFKYSRASYLAGLLRPQIIEDLQLEKHGFQYIPRDPSSVTPMLPGSNGAQGGHPAKFLLLGANDASTRASIAQFSSRDAERFPEYEAFLGKARDLLQPLLDAPPPNPFVGSARDRLAAVATIASICKRAWHHRAHLVDIYELMTGSAEQLLGRWFESDILKTTLATDAVIGAVISPRSTGSAYVLLHHVMGEAAGQQGVWAYVRGGMGAISQALAAAALETGNVEIRTSSPVDRILCEQPDTSSAPRVIGVQLSDGSRLTAPTVVSGVSPFRTYLELLRSSSVPESFSGALSETSASPISQGLQERIAHTDHSCGAFKINLAVSKLPGFLCCPPGDGESVDTPLACHKGTIHFEQRMAELHDGTYTSPSSALSALHPRALSAALTDGLVPFFSCANSFE
jgi:phytoene dehydrogenase-like protein